MRFNHLCFLLTLDLVLGDITAARNVTSSTSDLQTWWHDNGEFNYETPVRDENVRQSHVYATWVKSTTDTNQTYYNSFVYETIPRNGQGNIIIPGNASSISTEDDSITIEADIWITMGWTQFLYGSDAWVKISRYGNNLTTASDVVIRPTHLSLNVTDDGLGNVYVLVPYRAQGYRISVEFQDNLYSYRNGCNDTESDFVQDWHADGPNYVSNFTDSMPVMGVEPHDALLIFASPFPSSDLIPSETSQETYVVYPGLVPDLSNITSTNVYFTPGVYYMTATNHAVLSSSVDWVYLAPGAYVKGAVQFTTTSSIIKATGFGVLSGEQYVYQANTASGYTNNASNNDDLRMWSGYSTGDSHQTFVISGVTTNSPPFNSIDFFGDIDTISINQSDYKQVGAFFGQTDGTTLYTGSTVRDTFYHSNDDTIKTYGSNISVSDVIVWKGKTAPVIQFGWASRNLTNITVDGIDVIHSRYNSNGSHPSIIGANQVYGYLETQTDTADLSNTVKNVYFGNIRSEGIGGNLMRIVPLANYENVVIENVSLGDFSDRSNYIFGSQLPVWTDGNGSPVTITGFTIFNYTVNGTTISTTLDNTGYTSLGGLNIAEEFLAADAVITVQ
ncbi:family 49 glycoside hydrolase [Cryphonectria parasitica EP155]|uniref:Family 49 glycoside hydrolase n=1 Tax=Cryphonectria parasitica (strain ATCC 38755 / EP155) TaxID=660469 RepID=A0A9P5CT68_CRYP1|nr:family 49 glycoside hydrolase [Cryphonectria parasitica EP155]KAF3769352.1 family 49 glycoside hydrolase [Cryphonectria parasitica EP155]